jgi:branched-chain amino acid transport system substrate-binding protein
MKKRRTVIASGIALIVGLVALEAQSQSQNPKTHKIGAILAMSGGASWYGTVMSQGIQQAVAEINARGGVNGLPLEAVIEDHKSGNAQEAVSAMNRLMSIHGVKMVMTSFTAPTQAIAPLADQNKVFLINGGGVSNSLVGVSKYIVHNRSLAADLGRGAALQAKALGAKKIAAIQWKNDAGDSIVKVVHPAWEKSGGSIAAVEAVPQGISNMDTQIAKIKASNPDAIMLWMFNPEVGLALKRIREFGMKQPVIGVEYTGNDAKVAGTHGEGYYFLNDYFQATADYPWSMSFAKGYEERYKAKPEFYAANYYEGVYVLAELIKRVAAKGGTVDGDTMRAALQANPKFDSVYGGQMNFQENGVASKKVGLFQVKDGQNQFIKYIDLN